jgi:hypothetical protein
VNLFCAAPENSRTTRPRNPDRFPSPRPAALAFKHRCAGRGAHYRHPRTARASPEKLGSERCAFFHWKVRAQRASTDPIQRTRAPQLWSAPAGDTPGTCEQRARSLHRHPTMPPSRLRRGGSKCYRPRDTRERTPPRWSRRRRNPRNRSGRRTACAAKVWRAVRAQGAGVPTEGAHRRQRQHLYM